jgi:hypothetical protein
LGLDPGCIYRGEQNKRSQDGPPHPCGRLRAPGEPPSGHKHAASHPWTAIATTDIDAPDKSTTMPRMLNQAAASATLRRF